MTIERAYTLYRALRLHFTKDEYDITKTKGAFKYIEEHLKVNKRLKTYLDRARKRYAKTDDFIAYLVANFVYGDEWASAYQGNPAQNFARYRKAHDALEHHFSQHMRDLRNLDLGHPSTLDGLTLMRLCYSGKLSLESVAILDRHYEHITRTTTLDDPLWDHFRRKIVKYRPFVRLTRARGNAIITSIFS